MVIVSVCVCNEMITQDVYFDGDSECVCDEMITQDEYLMVIVSAVK